MFGCTGAYRYTNDLIELDRISSRGAQQQVQERLLGVITPLVLEHWESMLASHPDRKFVRYILQGIHDGFRIGFDGSKPVGSARKNMMSAIEHPGVVSDYLKKEMERGVLLGPFEKVLVPRVVTSRFGVIPKSGQNGKWRLIVDLSYPEGGSVNDGISSNWCSLNYVRVDNVVKRLLELGVGAEMAKLDVKSAYRIVPVHPSDRYLLGMMWDGKVFVDAALPFGLRSAPKIFNALADAVQWMAEQQGIDDIWHYLDDFITCAAAGSGECAANLQLLQDLCDYLGIPLATEKVEGPSTCLTFLGIEIDTVVGEVRLPQAKLVALCQALEEWQDKKRCKKRDLLSIAGKLQHASSVVRSGRTFVRRLFDLSTRVSKPDHHVKLNTGARSDLVWWLEFKSGWNGISLLSSLGQLVPTSTLTSDASGTWGCGAFWESKWFQLAWERDPLWSGGQYCDKRVDPNCDGGSNVREILEWSSGELQM